MIRQLSNSPYKTQLTPLIILTAISLLIWFGGPLIAIADYVPLEESEKRFYTIMALFLAWFLKIIFADGKTKEQTPKPATFKHPELTKKLELLAARFQGATDFLKKTLINKHGKDTSLHHLPWFLLVGPSGSGKTTFLANSNINFILSKQFKADSLNNTPPSDVCDWWVTRDSVLVDVPGFYLQSKQKNAANAPAGSKQKASMNHMLWKGFLDLLNKFRGKRAINGVIITLPLSDIMNSQNQTKERLVHDLKLRIGELRTQFGEHLPFYITITKCDLLPGFNEFFSDSGSDEIAQAWGVSLPRAKENEQLVDLFANRFNALIKRLNKQLIWRLHHERNPFTRPYIKDFPLQVERLKENILSLLKILSNTDKDLHLQGVYLSSAMQAVPEESNTTIHAANSSQTSLQIMRNPVMPSRAYFVKQLLLQGILSAENYPAQTTPTRKNNPKVVALSIGVMALVGLLLGNDIRDSIKQTYAIRNTLAQYQDDVNLQGAHLDKALPLVNALQKTAQKSSHTLLFYSDKAQQSANAAYQQALRTIVLPEIKNDLENVLQTSGKNPEQLYAALEAYLMLGDVQHIQPDFIISQLKQIAPTLFTPDNTQQLAAHIHTAFNTAWQPIPLDEDLIAKARKHLFNLSPVQLSFVILKSLAANTIDSTVSLGTNLGKSPALISHAIVSLIPTMYTADAFQSIYDQQIDSAATEATQGNWVLGSISTLNQLNNTPLVEQLRGLYVIDYINAWEKALASIQLATPANLAQADSIIKNLISKNSPLIELLKTVKQNTAFAPIMAASPKLAALNALLSENDSQNNGLTKIFGSLSQVHGYLQEIMDAKDVNNAAFLSVSTRMKNAPTSNDPLTQLFNLAKTSPDPIRTWLNNIAAQSWHFMLTDASHFVENRWQSEILSTYHSKLANRFPFAAEANQDVELEQFTKFLGTKGTLTNFYRSYLQPFVEATDKGWQWKSLDNEKMPFTAIALSQLQQAEQLQLAFFQNEDDKLFVKFTLQPLALETNTKSVHLNINGQAVQYDRSLPKIPQMLVWPGSKATHETLLNVLTSNNQNINNNIKGSWGWFKLVNKASPKMINQKEMLLNFNVDGHNAKYMLFTQGRINPFLAMNLQHFKLPEQLGEQKA
ncbi:MAG: type VI secretion system membrane subunit TssM [Gammaproteobacteria bacterium]|nr:type VI secretion system membrane subunit TssM [Gammaproteobacteria bacterium]